LRLQLQLRLRRLQQQQQLLQSHPLLLNRSFQKSPAAERALRRTLRLGQARLKGIPFSAAAAIRMTAAR